MTRVLRIVDDASTEAVEMFKQSASRCPFRLDPEDRLAEDRLAERREFQERIRYLRRKKLISTRKTEEGLLYELTDEGRVELLSRCVKERPLLSNDEVCLVVYDVPVEASLGRDALRYFLKRIGFTQVQQSIWQTDKDVVSEVRAFVRSAKIQKWVQVYLARKQG